MAYLYQEIMKVPGLTGTWQQRNKQLYERLGSPLGKYTGSYSQNVWLLNQIKAGNYGQAPQAQPAQPAQPQVSAGTLAGQQAAQGAAVEDFSKMLPYEQYFDPNLAKSGIMARTAQYFNPLVAQAREGIESSFAQRGLSRSGARGQTVGESYRDYLDQERQMQEQLLAQRQKEAQEGYSQERARYEENPTGYTPSTQQYKGYDLQQPEDSPYRYAKSYRDWMKGKYNF